ALAAADGIQPVVDVDINEELHVMPLASSVERWLNLTVRYLKETPDLNFPWEVPDLLAEDSALVALLKAGAFAPYVGGDRELADFITQVIAAHDSNMSRPHTGGDGE